jgi:Ca2+-binding RTX toxin-like protein
MGAGNDMASGATELINSTVSFDGGAGNDRLFYAQAGSIALTGDTGDDTLVAPLVNGVSSLIGGPGNDSARMAGNAAVSVNVTLDGIANDGPAGQQVSNVDVENVTTPGGSITGDAGPNVIAIGAYSGANTVSAGGGDDTVTTSIGSDTVDLGAGRDSAATGDRNDTVEARDGEADVIDCGDGVDSVVADAVDVTATTCETVSRPEPVNPPDNSFELKMETLNRKTGTATLTIVVPGPGKLNAVGKGIKSATATATAPGPVELVIKPRSRAKKKLNHTGKYKVTVSVQYTPTLGSANTQTEKLTLKKRI